MTMVEGVLVAEAILPSELSKAPGVPSENRDVGGRLARSAHWPTASLGTRQLSAAFKGVQAMFIIAHLWYNKLSANLL
jgi:hypothetical protein